MAGLLEKMPGMGNMAQAAQATDAEKKFHKMEAIINSMTLKERSFPDTLNGSRKRRIAQGSGTQIPDINSLLKQHKQMQKMMKKMSGKGGMKNLMRGMGGNLPQGMGMPSGMGMPPGMNLPPGMEMPSNLPFKKK